MLQKLVLAGMLAAAMAFAQGGMGGMDEGGMGGGGGRGRGRAGDMGSMENMGGGPRARRQSKTEQIADKLKLNKEQREQFDSILAAGREKAAPIREQMDKQRAQIAGALIGGKGGEEVDKMWADYSAAAAQMTALETEAYGKIWAMLKPNQQKRGPEAFELMAGIFSAPARGTGRGRGEGR
ncbi:MAG TPA: Spy/CpxP family protein refolding chaperone [Bryobacteraceae bacterium]|jgi:hypothetical protein|nr:Spy/CpxP family protein refolding chaperone [Bryobacteraceae bacterium]